MRVDFFVGVVKADSGEQCRASWARTPYGYTILKEGNREPVHGFDSRNVVAEDNITTVELPGLEREMVETIVVNVLKRGLLEKPGIRGKGDAVLYVLLNEALQKLEEASEDEEL